MEYVYYNKFNIYINIYLLYGEFYLDKQSVINSKAL